SCVGFKALRSPPEINEGRLMHAGDGAVGRAGFLRQKLAADLTNRVLSQRRPRIAALLRAVMHQPVFTDIQVAGSSAAAPVVRTAQSNVVLELVKAGVTVLAQLFHFGENGLCFLIERAELAGAVMDNSHRGGKAQFHG